MTHRTPHRPYTSICHACPPIPPVQAREHRRLVNILLLLAKLIYTYQLVVHLVRWRWTSMTIRASFRLYVILTWYLLLCRKHICLSFDECKYTNVVGCTHGIMYVTGCLMLMRLLSFLNRCQSCVECRLQTVVCGYNYHLCLQCLRIREQTKLIKSIFILIRQVHTSRERATHILLTWCTSPSIR